jgi:ribonucleoside-diphosphate reductase alpha chain
VDDEKEPSEIFIRIRGEAGSEKVTCYDVIARLISLAIQEGIAIEAIAERLHGTRMEPSGPVDGDARIKFCDGTLDYVGRHLLVNYCGRDELAHVKKGVTMPYALEEST